MLPAKEFSIGIKAESHPPELTAANTASNDFARLSFHLAKIFKTPPALNMRPVHLEMQFS